MKCPICGSKRVGRILYGYPAFNETTIKRINEEKLYLGGCCISECDPIHHCFACEKDFGSPPVLLGKRGKEDYRDITTGICFSMGGFWGERKQVLIKKKYSRISLNVISYSSEPKDSFKRLMAEEEWIKLLDLLFCKLYLHEWKKEYIDSSVLDGDQWDLEINLTHRRIRYYHGSNAYPPYWTELKSAFRPFFKEARIEF